MLVRRIQPLGEFSANNCQWAPAGSRSGPLQEHGAGPDLGRLALIRSIAGGREIYAAGGVRNAADLLALKQAGVSGALIATALHERKIVRSDLEAM
jgi:hypothetical protein